MLGKTTETVRADEVREGDWTTFSGNRLVREVRSLKGKRVGLVRANGRMDKLNRDDQVVVYREQREETAP